MREVSTVFEVSLPLEQRRFEILEPLLFEADQTTWINSIQKATSLLGGHSAALVMASSNQQHILLGQVGMTAEFEISKAIAAEISPANVALILEHSAYLDYEEAQQWGLSCWLRASRSQGLAITPLKIGDTLVGALVLGLSDVPSQTRNLEGLTRLGQEISIQLNHVRAHLQQERQSGLTVVDPGAARIALRGALRRMEPTLLQLALLSSQLWRGLALHSEEEILTSGPRMLKLYQEAQIWRENLAIKLRMLVEWSSPEGGEWANRQALLLAQGLLGLRSLLLLGEAIGKGQLSPEQGSIALKMLGSQGPDTVQMTQVVHALQGWLEEIPSSGRISICNKA